MLLRSVDGFNFKVSQKGLEGLGGAGGEGGSPPMGLDQVGAVCLRSWRETSILKVPRLGLGALIPHVFNLDCVGVVCLWGGRAASILKVFSRGCVGWVLPALGGWGARHSTHFTWGC